MTKETETTTNPLGAEIMKEVKRYDDGTGCTRRQLVDNILILFNQYARCDSAAVVDGKVNISFGPGTTDAASGDICPKCGGSIPTCCRCPLPCARCGHVGMMVKGLCRAVVNEFGPQNERRVCGCACYTLNTTQTAGASPAPPSAAATVDADIANSAANKIADYFNAPPSVVPAIEQIIKRCASASSVALRDEAGLSGFSTSERLSTQEDKPVKNYDDFRAGMLRAADMARDEFKRVPEAAKNHDCVYMGGYEDACDHLSQAIAQAAVIDSVRIAGPQPDWQYHIPLLLPEGIEDTTLLKIYQIVEHELRAVVPSSPPPRELAQAAAEENEREIIRLGGFKHAVVFNANSIRKMILRTCFNEKE